jgi:cytochrome c oxidase assembly protein subunit 11
MMTISDKNRQTASRANVRMGVVCVAIVAGMVGMAYAAVPLYDMFCKVTGYGGTTRRAETAPVKAVSDREIRVRFDANVAPDLPWSFKPVEKEVTVKLGEQRLTYYRAVNKSDRPVTGMATFNVTPTQAGYYFNKIDCFCFTEQTLEPGQSIDMPVLFFVDEELAADKDTANVRTLTLSYTFYVKDPVDKSAAAEVKNSSQSDGNSTQSDRPQRGGVPVEGTPENTGAEGHG